MSACIRSSALLIADNGRYRPKIAIFLYCVTFDAPLRGSLSSELPYRLMRKIRTVWLPDGEKSQDEVGYTSGLQVVQKFEGIGIRCTVRLVLRSTLEGCSATGLATRYAKDFSKRW